MKTRRWLASVVGAFLVLGTLSISCNSKTASTPAEVAVTPTVKDDDLEPYDGTPWFEDVTARTGIRFQYHNGETANHLAIIESLGGGLALFDFNNDGLLDLYICGGGDYQGKSVVGRAGKLYQNLGDFKFKDVTKEAGLDQGLTYSHATAVADINRDGYPDLLLTGYNRLVLYLNVADGARGRKFEDITEKAGLTERLWSTGAAFADLDGDGYPELYVCHYGDWGFETNHPTDCKYDNVTLDVCPPKRFKPLPHYLYRNNKNSTFTNISEELKLRKDGKGLGVVIADYTGDGRPDLYVANDTDDNFLYVNRTKAGTAIKLEELGGLSGVARDNRAVPNGSMGLDVGDPLRSGKPSIFVTNYEGELHALYVNQSGYKPDDDNIFFDYESHRNGLQTLGHLMVGWGASFCDFDRDGWEDLIVVHGHAIRYPKTGAGRQQKAKLLLNEQGKFKRISNRGGSYFTTKHNSRGLGLGDLDNDGKPDLVINSIPDPKENIEEPIVILKNTVPTKNNWVGIAVVGEKFRDVVGGRIVIECGAEKYTRFIKAGGSYASTIDPRYTVGIGQATTIDRITIVWPNGATQEWKNLAGNRYWKLTEGSPEAK